MKEGLKVFYENGKWKEFHKLWASSLLQSVLRLFRLRRLRLDFQIIFIVIWSYRWTFRVEEIPFKMADGEFFRERPWITSEMSQLVKRFFSHEFKFHSYEIKLNIWHLIAGVVCWYLNGWFLSIPLNWYMNLTPGYCRYRSWHVLYNPCDQFTSSLRIFFPAAHV